MFVDSPIDKIEKNSDKIICQSCGVEFSCSANVGNCWCFSVNVNAETLAELQESYKNCLCEKCLIESLQDKN